MGLTPFEVFGLIVMFAAVFFLIGFVSGTAYESHQRDVDDLLRNASSEARENYGRRRLR